MSASNFVRVLTYKGYYYDIRKPKAIKVVGKTSGYYLNTKDYTSIESLLKTGKYMSSFSGDTDTNIYKLKVIDQNNEYDVASYDDAPNLYYCFARSDVQEIY